MRFASIVVAASFVSLRISADELDLTIPLPMDIFAAIVPAEQVGPEDNAKDLMERGIIQKWTKRIDMFFIASGEQRQADMSATMQSQLIPFLTSVSEATGLHFKRVRSAADANLVLVYGTDLNQEIASTDLNRAWSDLSAEEFQTIVAPLIDPVTNCRASVFTERNEIERVVAFVSATLSASDREKCLARSILSAVGLRGDATSSASAKARDSSSRSIGMLDEMALNLIYNPKVSPGMTISQALHAASSQ